MQNILMFKDPFNLPPIQGDLFKHLILSDQQCKNKGILCSAKEKHEMLRNQKQNI